MRPIHKLPQTCARGLKYLLHDIDDTITNDGKLLPWAYAALWKLRGAGIRVIPVTGRPAGWCDLIIRQWPVDAVIGENGAFVYYLDTNNEPKVFIHPSAVSTQTQLNAVRDACLAGVPGCRVAKDQFARLYDLAIDFCEDPPRLGLREAGRIRDIAEEMGARAKISSIHVNIWFGEYDKLAMAKLFFEQVWGKIDMLEAGLFIGDSPNDEPMFAAFPASCGVANIRAFADSMVHLPAYVTEGQGGAGFAEAVERILMLRGQ
ncbi:MAG: HAD-IIB family hydrolase [Clostridia bacterium]|nr:HAD-IIB family hydrolase [Clostridia bacterium]